MFSINSLFAIAKSYHNFAFCILHFALTQIYTPEYLYD